MKINVISNANYNKSIKNSISFKAIYFDDYNPNYNSSKELLKEELNKFSRTTKNAKFIGEGISAKAYILQKLPNFVIKEAYNSNETFYVEEANLKDIVKKYNSVQKFVARAYDDKTHNYVLVTTKVSGATPNPKSAPFSRAHLTNLFDELYKLDTNCIYHGDLNLGNIK